VWPLGRLVGLRGRAGDQPLFGPPSEYPTVRSSAEQNLAFEADRLLVSGRRANVAQRQPVFDQGCPSAAVASTEHEGVFAD
jgi:hypothetical protein